MHPIPVSISLSSYGADYVRQRGQEQFIDLLARAGARRVELREELFSCLPDPLALGAVIAGAGLDCVYSTPLELWAPDGLPDTRVTQKLHIAHELGAAAVKVSLGHYHTGCDLTALRELVPAQGPRLLVENDQTSQGGRIAALLAFFQRADEAGLGVGMTFDIGNWQWQGEAVEQAASQLGRWVQYVHCKAVRQLADGRLAAAPPQVADLQAWDRLLAQFSSGVVRAVEYPLVGDDLLQVTRDQVRHLAVLGLGARAEEVSHA